MAKYIKNNAKTVKQTLKFKCYDCKSRYAEYGYLRRHVSDQHTNLIMDGITVDQYIYNNRNKKTEYLCVICKKNSVPWNQDKLRYDRFCSDGCKKKARQIYEKNMMNRFNKITLLNDPEHQVKMLEGRRISGKYIMNDGVEINYTAKYELDFLQYIDKELKLTSMDVLSSPLQYIFYYHYNGKKMFYIPDFYMPEYNLLVEIKDSSEYPIESKEKSRLKDKAVIKGNKCNYIKIVDKKYDDFIELLDILKQRKESDASITDYIFVIPE